MSPTVKSAGLAAGLAAGVAAGLAAGFAAGFAAVCASASAQGTASAIAARALPVFILQPPLSPLSVPHGAPEILTFTIRGLETHACSFENSAPPSRRPAARSAELARNIVVERDTHQDDEQGDAKLLSQSLGPLRQRAALQPLHQLEDDLSAIQDRNRQQVEEPQRQGNGHQEAEERRPPRLG